jgi:hypothetical protein
MREVTVVACPRCAATISRDASVCPNCGALTRTTPTMRGFETLIDAFLARFWWCKGRTLWLLLFAVLAAAVVFNFAIRSR